MLNSVSILIQVCERTSRVSQLPKCKHKCNDTRRLKWSGVTPKYNFRFADDWVILTSTEQEAYRLKRVQTKYFTNKMKLELSQEKRLQQTLEQRESISLVLWSKRRKREKPLTQELGQKIW